MDRNKDGYITKGELKLAKKSAALSEIDEVRNLIFAILLLPWPLSSKDLKI